MNVYTLYNKGVYLINNMRTKIVKWGNSLAVRLPKPFTDQLNLEKDSNVELFIEQDKIIIKKQKYSLKNLLTEINESNIHEETNAGNITGKEIW